MIYIYFFIKSLINLSRNSVRFENSSGNRLSDRLNSVRFYLTVGGMACMPLYVCTAVHEYNCAVLIGDLFPCMTILNKSSIS